MGMREITVFIRPEVQGAPGFEFRERARMNGNKEEEVTTEYEFCGVQLSRENGHFVFRMDADHGVIPVALMRFVDTSKLPVFPDSIS